MRPRHVPLNLYPQYGQTQIKIAVHALYKVEVYAAISIEQGMGD
jgi:hypothetical protein